MSRVLVVSNDYVRKAMAGPAIRNVELARQLERAGNEVTLAVPVSTDLEDLPFQLDSYDPSDPTTLSASAAGADVVVLQGWVLERNPFLRETGARLVVDLYDPFPLEHLATVAIDGRPERFPPWDEVLGTLLRQVRLGDFFLCASERQRDFWLGMMLALSRINAATYERDPSLRSLVDVVPFGVPDVPPRKKSAAMRGVLPGIGDGDFVLLWAGGVYNWFDPLTLIEALAEVALVRPRTRLCFLAASHPNPEVPKMEMLTRARRRAEELGLTGSHVFFNETWVPYEARGDWLLESDAGISTHTDHVETRFSFRTRVLDYLWAGLPVICTAGDSLADLIKRREAGLTVASGDRRALVQAIQTLIDDTEGRARRARNARALGRTMTWERAAGPLVRYCARPWAAPDLAGLAPDDTVAASPRSDTHSMQRLDGDSRDLGRLVRRALQILDEEGPVSLARRLRRKLHR